ncbi:MAG: N-6 DNA methylase [Planctomycetaceae bacterium]|jgi:predicted helicase|nr:N-6 DNA methylase [Planctomycetaceae bacterium]
MEIAKNKTAINLYVAKINSIYENGNATEHSYRPALQQLLEKITKGLTITNEPKRIDCGAPDYIVTQNEVPVGYVEAKDVGSDLNSKLHKEQLDRYKQSLGNLIVTDYLHFRLFQDNEQICSVTIGNVGKNIQADTAQYPAFLDLINHFICYRNSGILSAEQLSKMMAVKARFMARVIEKTLNNDNNNDDDKVNGDNNCNNNSLLQQLESFREVLIHDMPNATFADIYSQTIAYGMFASRLNDKTNTPFTRAKAAGLVPQSNPFLRKLFQYIAGFDLDNRINWVVDALADLFNYIDTDKLFKEFDQTTQDQDPMIHFYETFLAEYDPMLRKSRGVWYTPQPVVRFIVQAVDDLLKQEFNLPRGLADNSKVKLKLKQETGQKKNTVTSAETTAEYHKVQILDPATGTGTFLAEIVNIIYQQFQHQQGMWNNYVNEHLIPRLNGFEILMAPYAMAHLKLDMILRKTGYHADNKRLHIYLTNSLEEAQPTVTLPFAQWLSDEVNAANRIKAQTPVMVVLGNPPYNVSSQNKSQWIQNLIGNYKTGLKERNIQPLSDDYIKFIRYGQHFIEKNGKGIMAYVSNNSFIDGLIYRQMRKSLLESFDTIYIFDLHGNTRKKETIPDNDHSIDKNVFDIQQGVSINIFIKTGYKKTGLAGVFHSEMYGQRDEKYQFLSQKKLKTIKWRKLKFEDDHYFFVPKDFSLQQEYEKGLKITEIFCKHTSGIKTHRDKEYVGFNAFKNNNQFYHYRPFDIRYIEYDLEKIVRPRYEMMKHVLKSDNISLCTCRQQSSFKFQHVFVTKYLSDICSVSLQTKETAFIFPLYIYPDNVLLKDTKRMPNLNEDIVNKIAVRLGLNYTQEKIESKKTFAPIDLLDYIYAVLHSPAYRERYKEFLKIDFPRIPYPKDVTTFWTLAAFGFKLRQLHLLEEVEPLKNMATYPQKGNNTIEQPIFKNNQIWINNIQYFDNVPIETWEFYIGGYQPAQKWLKDRRERTLNFQDIQHYQKIITALDQTSKIQKKINMIEF